MSQIVVSPTQTVKSLQQQFKKHYGAHLRVYKGQHFADRSARLQDLVKEEIAGGILVVRRGVIVSDFEKAFKERFGVTVQVAVADNSKLAKNDVDVKNAGK